MPSAGDPRTGAEYLANAAAVLANSDVCHLCGHGGAATTDHIISVYEWLVLNGTYEGVNAITNLAPAHGTRGPNRPANRCMTCGKVCNQSRGERSLAAEPRSRNWYAPDLED